MHRDHTPHIQRPLRQPERVGYGELVVYLVRGVAVEDYACLAHDLLSCRDLAAVSDDILPALPSQVRLLSDSIVTVAL
jgi:hypothetical protein